MKKSSLLGVLILLLSTTLFTQELVKIVTYNVLNYPDNSYTRNTYFEKIFDELDADIVVVQEIESQSGVNEFQSKVLGAKFQSGTFVNGPDDDKALFYRDSLFTFISNTPISTELRDINEFKVVHNFTLDTLRIYAVHLKASDGSSERDQRLREITNLRNVTDQLPENTYYMVLGDFNVYYSNEPAIQKLIDQSTTGYFLDPINQLGNWHNNSGYAFLHTQSTRANNIGDGGASGGLDDRFDQILVSQSIMNNGGIDYVESSYYAFGNDGNHFNSSINSGTNTSVSNEIADALYYGSDHLPVVATFDFGISTGIKEGNNIATDFTLKQNYPNPFNPSTNISYNIPVESNVTIKIYDMLGREITELLNSNKLAGNYTTGWNASAFSAGVYFYSIEAVSLASNEYFRETKKMILMK